MQRAHLGAIAFICARRRTALAGTLTSGLAWLTFGAGWRPLRQPLTSGWPICLQTPCSRRHGAHGCTSGAPDRYQVLAGASLLLLAHRRTEWHCLLLWPPQRTLKQGTAERSNSAPDRELGFRSASEPMLKHLHSLLSGALFGCTILISQAHFSHFSRQDSLGPYARCVGRCLQRQWRPRPQSTEPASRKLRTGSESRRRRSLALSA